MLGDIRLNCEGVAARGPDIGDDAFRAGDEGNFASQGTDHRPVPL
jgi:hypothetical protein